MKFLGMVRWTRESLGQERLPWRVRWYAYRFVDRGRSGALLLRRECPRCGNVTPVPSTEFPVLDGTREQAGKIAASPCHWCGRWREG